MQVVITEMRTPGHQCKEQLMHLWERPQKHACKATLSRPDLEAAGGI